jgi:MinD superfamily P-loop ATPase
MVTSLSEGACQLVVVDSPGLIGIEHAKKMVDTHAEAKILVDPEKALQTAEHVLVVDDATAPGEYLHHRVLHLLHRNPHIPSSLIINKCDLIRQKTMLLQRARILTCGMVGGVPMSIEGPKLGKLGRMAERRSTTISLSPMANRLEEKDEKWTIAYK